MTEEANLRPARQGKCESGWKWSETAWPQVMLLLTGPQFTLHVENQDGNGQKKSMLKLLRLVAGYLGLDGVDLTLSAFLRSHPLSFPDIRCWNEEVHSSFSWREFVKATDKVSIYTSRVFGSSLPVSWGVSWPSYQTPCLLNISFPDTGTPAAPLPTPI